MFGRSKPVVFDPYGRRRSRLPMPRWLLLLLIGAVVGAFGVVFVQERYLPPRLSARESVALRDSFERADSERRRLDHQMIETTKRLQAALTENKALAEAASAGKRSIERLRTEVSTLVDLLPPDPRGGAVQVRAADFSAQSGKLAYDVVLSRDRAGSKPLTGVVQFVVAGAVGRGPETTVDLAPLELSIDRVASLHGELPLPEGFLARQTRINVLDRPGGRLLGTRVIRVETK
jgi:hypothetical protein